MLANAYWLLVYFVDLLVCEINHFALFPLFLAKNKYVSVFLDLYKQWIHVSTLFVYHGNHAEKH